MQPEWSKRTKTFPSSQHTEIEDQKQLLTMNLHHQNLIMQVKTHSSIRATPPLAIFEDTLTDLTYVMTDIKKGLASRDTVLQQLYENLQPAQKIRGADGKKKSYTKPLLISALHNFVKEHGRKIRSNKCTITVQPTTLSRRAIKKCGGKPLKAGRPSLMQRKSNNTNMKNLCRHTLPKRKLRSKRVHSLQTSIDNRRQNAC